MVFFVNWAAQPRDLKMRNKSYLTCTNISPVYFPCTVVLQDFGIGIISCLCVGSLRTALFKDKAGIILYVVDSKTNNGHTQVKREPRF